MIDILVVQVGFEIVYPDFVFFFSKIFSDFYRDLVKVEIESNTKAVSVPIVIVRNTS